MSEAVSNIGEDIPAASPGGDRKCAILQSCYIPWKGFFDLVNTVDDFVVYDCVQYTKNDWRNRNKIKTDKGAEWLTIPVSVNNRLQTRIDQVAVANSNWRRSHWSSLAQAYSKTPYFAQYRDQFEECYLRDDETNLSKINRRFMNAICTTLGIETNILDSTELELVEDRNMRLIHICKQLGANLYFSGPAAKSYLDEDLFRQHGISVSWFDYAGYPEYTQRFPPFRHDVTVLDLLFNLGPAAPQFMKSFGARSLIEA